MKGLLRAAPFHAALSLVGVTTFGVTAPGCGKTVRDGPVPDSETPDAEPDAATASGCRAHATDLAPGELVWSHSFEDWPALTLDDLAADSNCNVFALGGTRGDEGGSGYVRRLVVAKLGPGGDREWILQWDGEQTPRGVLADASGDLVVYGGFKGELAIGGERYRSEAFLGDGFIAKLDGASGAPLWSLHLPVAALGGAALDASDNIVVAGTRAAFAFPEVTGTGSVFWLRLSPDGDLIEGRRYGDAEPDLSTEVNSLDVGADDSFVMSGRYVGPGSVCVDGAEGGECFPPAAIEPLDFGAGPLSNGAFVVRIDPAGQALWSAAVDVEGPVRAALAPDEATWLVASPWNDADLGGGPLGNDPGYDVVVARYDRGGDLVFGKRFGDPPGVAQSQIGVSVLPLGHGGALVAGYFEGGIELFPYALEPAGSSDSFVAELDATGEVVAARNFGSAGERIQTALLDPRSDVVVSGLATTEPLDSAANLQRFVAKHARWNAER
jgi:hypothetical protein